MSVEQCLSTRHDDGALVTLAGREDVYHRVLARFLSHHAGLHQDLPRWRAAGDASSIQRALHTLRGSSVAVGAEHLAQCTQTVEVALAAAGTELPQPAGAVDSAVDLALVAVLQELQCVEDHIRSLLPPGADGDARAAAVASDPALGIS